MALIGVSVGLFAPVLYNHWYDQVATVRWALTIGIGGGFYAGYHNSRVTAQRVAAERAEVRAEEAAQRQELLEYLNALLRHEVLNAVNVIQGRALLLRRDLSDDPETEAHLETIERQSSEMSDIVDDVRTLLRANRQELEFSRIEITEMVRDSLLKFEDRYEGLETTVRMSDEAFVEASDLLPRVFDNLFRNAIEHNDSSPVRVTVMSVKTDNKVMIEIGDNGPGIPESLREGLFAPAIGQSDNQARLGTVIVGRLVEQHDGEIRILETGPDGTTIEVTLPLASA
ncbi:MAG: HAMP domain-containing sensor histidine kinase [Haloarculaceae archaeon]